MQAFIGLGSNLAEPVEQVLTAIDNIKKITATSLVKQSSLYKSPPMGPQDQPDYINAVVEIDTALSAHDLLKQLQQIELKQGRVRKRHWGERTIDLDILTYGQQVIDDEILKVPHPGVAQRAFVIYPLAEIAADLHIEVMGKASQLAANCEPEGIIRMDKQI
jgi:2-amino-4-hydroxy-6-hydroxymethyldihydropteridine diphosphokinase